MTVVREAVERLNFLSLSSLPIRNEPESPGMGNWLLFSVIRTRIGLSVLSSRSILEANSVAKKSKADGEFLVHHFKLLPPIP